MDEYFLCHDMGDVVTQLLVNIILSNNRSLNCLIVLLINILFIERS